MKEAANFILMVDIGFGTFLFLLKISYRQICFMFSNAENINNSQMIGG